MGFVNDTNQKFEKGDNFNIDQIFLHSYLKIIISGWRWEDRENYMTILVY